MTRVLSFEDWIGISVHDLPDCNYVDWYDDGMTPKRAKRAASKAIRALKSDS